MREIINGNNLALGTCYYPEHWDRSLWEEDLNRMLEAGIRIIRIAEFAWNKIEPREGEYTYEFFDSFLDVVEKTSMKVIFCTPTATPPAWLVEEYPEVLNAQMDGTGQEGITITILRSISVLRRISRKNPRPTTVPVPL